MMTGMPQGGDMSRSSDWLLRPQAVRGIGGRHALAGPISEHVWHGQKLKSRSPMAPSGAEIDSVSVTPPFGKHSGTHEVPPDPRALTVRSLMPGTPVVWAH